MDQELKKEIDSVISAIADEGMSSENTKQLETLLYNKPESQDYYAHVITVHTLLAGEYAHTNSLFTPTHSPLSTSLSEDEQTREDSCQLLSRAIKQDLPEGSCTPSKMKRHLATALSLAALIFVAICLPYWLTSETEQTAQRDRLWSASSADTKAEESILVHDRKSLMVLGQLTQDPFIRSLSLPASKDSKFNLCSGTVWIERLPKQRERGHLVALPAGCLMNVFLDTDARAQNSFAMVGISNIGFTNNKKIQFNNSVGNGSGAPAIRMGCIGQYSEYNDTSSTKYYLLVGSYIEYNGKDDVRWSQSDYKTLVDSENLLVIGWDDCGYSGYPEDGKERQRPDQDYNDLRATLQFSYPGREDAHTKSSISYLPELPEKVEIADSNGTGCFLNVKPGEELILSVSSEATLQNAIRVIDFSSQRILWEHAGSSASAENNLKQAANRGVFVIRNNGDIVKRYEIQGRFKPNPERDDLWLANQYKTVWKEEGVEVIGFEDSIKSQPLVDWQDLRVNARWIRSTQ